MQKIAEITNIQYFLPVVHYDMRQIGGVDFTGRFLGGYCCVENIFSIKVGLKFICAEFQFFHHVEVWRYAAL